MAEFFLCQNCKRNIPECNRTIHQVRCVRTGDPASHLASQHQMGEPIRGQLEHPTGTGNQPIVETSNWRCTNCACLNESENFNCVVCGSPMLPLESHVDVPQLPASSSGWACSRCTCINDEKDSVCDACNLVREPRPSFREQLLENDDINEHMMNGIESNPNSSSRMDSLLFSTVMGAGIGAGVAWMNERDVTSGALAGAGMGAMGDMYLNGLRNDSSSSQTTRPGLQNRGIEGMNDPFFAFGMQRNNPANLHLMIQMMMQELDRRPEGSSSTRIIRSDVDRMTFEELLERFQSPERGVDQQILDDLPTRQFASAPTANPHCSASANGTGVRPEKQSCSICLEEYSDGEHIRTLPCLHHFHKGCVDNWLRRSQTCPECKHEIR